MEIPNNNVNICKKIFNFSVDLSKNLSENQRRSLVFRLLNYLRVGNYRRVNNEIMKLINTFEIQQGAIKEFIAHWSNIYCSGTNPEFEKIAYSFLMGLLIKRSNQKVKTNI